MSIMKYLNGTTNQGMQYNSSSNISLLQTYCDADITGDLQIRRSITGYNIFFEGGALI